jgi:hypothetical protein
MDVFLRQSGQRQMHPSVSVASPIREQLALQDVQSTDDGIKLLSMRNLMVASSVGIIAVFRESRLHD